MITKLTSFLVFTCCAVSAFSQTTLILQPDSASGKDAPIYNCVPCGYDNMNSGSSDELGAIAWTNHGNISDERGLVQFDLSSISTEATIFSAALSLYHNPDPISGNPGQSHFSSSDASWVQRITSSWQEFTVTWDNQPSTTTLNEVALPEDTSANEDYLNIDVTAMVQDMVTNPSQSFGFMLRLQAETQYAGLLFASSDHANAALHPKLVISFTDPLPITLLNFSAQQKSNSVEIDWTTASEINNEFFTVWRSDDENHFVNIGTVTGAGSSNSAINYSFNDDNPLSGNSYYRLSQTDFDGKTKTFNPLFVSRNEAKNNAIISTGMQPFNNNLNINYYVKIYGTVEFDMINCLGEIVKSDQADAIGGINSFNFNDVSCLPNGVYFIKMAIGNEYITPLKVVKM